MESDRQLEIVRAMQDPGFYPHPVKAVKLHETHISKVLLTGDFVYKIKKPVNLGFLDFTSLEKRRHFCRLEVELNRRLTHGIYLGVVDITAENQRYYLEGRGQAVECAVKMKQLPAEASMAGLLPAAKIDAREIEQLAGVLSGFYKAARTGPAVNAAGSWETVKSNCEENFTQTEEFADHLIDLRRHQIIRSITRSFLQRRKALFERRLKENKIREGHGDLRTDHIYFTEDGIQIIDCIEFNERFRCDDIASDLAFLAMDLDFQGHPEVAGALLEAYALHSGDRDVFILLDFFKCYRAFVRAKVGCLRIKQGRLPDGELADLRRQTRRYLEFAYQYALRFTRPTIWVVCGMIATGKSTVADALADALQIKALRSDAVRKILFGHQDSAPGEAEFEAGIYTTDATALTYGKLLLLAQEEIEHGNSVILDATFSRAGFRREALRLAEDMDTNIFFVECRCRESLIRDRLRKRETFAPISDARLKHLQAFKSGYEAPDEIPPRIKITLDTERPLAENIEKIFSRDVGLAPER